MTTLQQRDAAVPNGETVPSALWPVAAVAAAHGAVTAAHAGGGLSAAATAVAHAAAIAPALVAVAAVAARGRGNPGARVTVQPGWSAVLLAGALTAAQGVLGATFSPAGLSASSAALLFGWAAFAQAVASAVVLAAIPTGHRTTPADGHAAPSGLRPTGGAGPSSAIVDVSPARPKPRVFVSHATADRAFVEARVIAPLRAHGIETWYSKDDIGSAELWEHKIREALGACDWLLVVVSRHAAASPWVRAEVMWGCRRALDRVVPVVIDETRPEELNVLLISVQYIDFTLDPRDATRRLLRVWGADMPDRGMPDLSQFASPRPDMGGGWPRLPA